jgi:AcrR family transcriptional regulator
MCVSTSGHPPPTGPRDLLAWPHVHDADRKDWSLWFQAQGIEDVGAPAGPRSTTRDCCCKRCWRGQGAGLVPTAMAAADLEAGRLVRLAGHVWPASFAYYIGRLAGEVGMSKAGLFGHFGSKEALQIATIDTAWSVYQEEVARPVQAAALGAPQLRMYLERYIQYVTSYVDEGGCFFTAVSSEFDDREGAVRTRVREIVSERNGLVEYVVRAAVASGHLPSFTDVAQMSFEILSLVTGANLAFQLTKDPVIFRRLRQALRRLTPPSQGRRSESRRVS